MLRIASRGHRTLCLGQGAELCWERDPKPMCHLKSCRSSAENRPASGRSANGSVAGGADDEMRESSASIAMRSVSRIRFATNLQEFRDRFRTVAAAGDCV